ncbi:MAG TPA: tRNA lysidine(34) synthetase TilS [Actinomycetota bacterium]|nr:tRNA lysidine(34) synthetase TilS [Actinomycetota bacterium]
MRRPPAVARVLERVTAMARAHGMFEPGDLVIVACSGGPDSVCLLHALSLVRRLLRVRLAVFHFDHRLRPGSADDAAYVARQAERLGLPCLLRRADDAPGPGQSVEAWARLARYAALTSAATDAGADRAALGHTLDDQAETVLLGLVRGGGLEAVAAMAPVAAVPPLGFPAVRPLLETSRADVLAFCRALRLRPREDPTNRDRRFLRNRIRHDVLPVLEERLDRGVKATLARTAANVRADADHLEVEASDAAREVTHLGEGELRLDAAALAALPRPIAARVVRQALRLAGAMGGGWEPEPGSAHVTGVLDLAAGRRGRRLDLPGALLAVRAKEYVALSRASPEAARRSADEAPSPRRRPARASPRGRRERGRKGKR